MAHELDGGEPVADRVQPADLGARIAALREAAGVSVDDVAARTRIRASLIRSMEAGDFAPCGGAVYARGHLRSIGHVVHADDAELVAAYDRMAGLPSPSAATVVEAPAAPSVALPFASVADKPLPTPVQVTGTRESHDQRRAVVGSGLPLPGSSAGLREHRGNRMVLAAVAVAAVVVVIAGIALAVPHRSTNRVAAAPLSTPTAPRGGPSPAAVTPTAPATLAAAGVNVTVTVATSSSWVHVVDGSGAIVFQGILSAGTSKAFHAADQLKFVFGNAPAVHLVVNGHDIGSPPPSGGGGDVADAVFDTTSGG